MPITSVSQLVSAWSTSASLQNIHCQVFDKDLGGGVLSAGPDCWYECLLVDGTKGFGSVPTTVEAPTSATAGAIGYRDAATGTNYLTRARLRSGQGSLHSMLYDRLLHIGGLDGTVTTAQTVGGTITRNTGGVGNQIWVEVWTSVGSTRTTISASYTNQAGTSGRTTRSEPFGANSASDYFSMMLPLQSGDTGVQSVESVTLAATTGTAGNFGVCIARPLAYEGGFHESVLQENRPHGTDFVNDFASPIALEDATCLALKRYQPGSTEDHSQLWIEIVEVP